MSMAPLLPEEKGSIQSYTNLGPLGNVEKQLVASLDKFVQELDQPKPKRTKLHHSLNVLDPDSTYMIIWRLINLICIYVYLFELPIALVFQNTRRDRQHVGYLFEIMNVPCIFIFLVNMVIQMRLPFYKHGILITNSREILRHYFKFMFALDIISLTTIIAYEFNQINDESKEVERVISRVNLLFYVKVAEVFMINNLNRNVLQLHRRLLAAYNMVVLFMGILLISNIFGCTFYQVSEATCDTSTHEISCWIESPMVAGVAIREHEWYIQYVYSLYWSSTTMLGVGYGDITPKNPFQTGFTIFAEFISCGIFAYSINQVWQIFTDMRQKETKYQKQFNIINRYMRDRKVKEIVSNKVKAYLTHYYRYERKGEKDKEMEIIEDLAPAIKEELLMDTYGRLFGFEVWQGFTEELFEQLVGSVKELRFPEGEVIQSPEEEELDPCIKYIYKGSVQVALMVGSQPKQLQPLNNGSLFGEFEFFTQQITQTVVTSSQYCSVYLMKYSKFRACLEGEDLQHYFQIKHKALYLNDLSRLRIGCQFCLSSQHTAQNCSSAKIRQRDYSVIKFYRTSANPRMEWRRPHRRLVHKLSTKNELAAVVKLLNRKRVQREDHKADYMSLNQSMIDVEPALIGSFIQSSNQPNRPLTTRKNKSQVLGFPIYRPLSVSIDLKKIQTIQEGSYGPFPRRELDKGFQRREVQKLSHQEAQVQEMFVGEMSVIDEVQNYEGYFPEHNITNVVSRNFDKKKGSRRL